MPDSPVDVTQLLTSDDPDAAERALPFIYDTLRKVASSQLRHERDDHTMETGDLVHEVYFRLSGMRDVQWENRKHFLLVAATAMRRYLIDYARSRNTAKRSKPDHLTVTLPNIDNAQLEIMDLERALTKLESVDEELATVVKLRFYAGMPAADIGPVLKLSPMAVSRRWWQAKQWLKRELSGDV